MTWPVEKLELGFGYGPKDTVPTPSLTVSGNEITDAVRAAGVEGDGRSADSSYGIYQAAQNVVPNGGFETNLTGWSSWPTATRITTDHMFGVAACSIPAATAPNDYSSCLQLAGTLPAASPGQIWTASMCNKVGTGAPEVYLVFNDAGHGNLTWKGPWVVIGTIGSWQRWAITAVAPASTAEMIIYAYNQSATSACIVDAFQLEQSPIATPYKHTDGAPATRPAARVQAPATLLDEAQGWAAFRIRYGYPSTAIPDSPHLLFWFDDWSNYIRLYLDQPSRAWYAERKVGGALSLTGSAVQTFALDDGATVIAAWTATTLKISVNGGAFVTIADTNIPALAATLADLGSQAGTARHLNSRDKWTLMGKGTLTDADAATLYALGDTDPTTSTLPTAASTTALWPAVTAAYSVPFFYSLDDLPGGRSRARNLTITRTRSDELQRYDSFPATTVLSNPDAALNPENSASPYDASPSTPFRYTLNGNVTYYGFTSGFPQTYPDVLDATVNLTALDRLSLLNRRKFQGATIFASALSGQRFYDVLVTNLGYSAVDVDLDTGMVTCAETADLIGTNPLDHLQEIALAEGGRFFASKDGKFTFRDQVSVLEQFAVKQGTFGNENLTQLPFRLVNDEITHDASKIYNGVYITDSAGVVSSASDTTSQDDYGEFDYNQTFPVIESDALSRAQRILREYKDPHLRIPALEILWSRNPAICQPIIDALEIGQLFGFRYQPFADGSDMIDIDVVVDGITITSVPGEFHVVVQLWPADSQRYWLSGIAGFSESGVTTYSF